MLDKIRDAITQTIDFMLKSLRTEIMIGDVGYSLESLCKLVGEGELSIKGGYTARGSKPR